MKTVTEIPEYLKSCVIEAPNLETFIMQNYKHERLGAKGERYVSAVIDSHRNCIGYTGYTCISKHESIQNRIVCYIGKEIDFTQNTK